MPQEKLSPHQFILILHGPSCGGKSTVSDLLFRTYAGIYKGKTDTIKRLISDYDYATQFEMVSEMTLATMKIALAHGLSIVKEGGMLHGIDELRKISQDIGIPLFIATIEAPWEVLLERFEVRINNPRPNVKINTDVDRFRKIFDEYHATKPMTPLAFDSSVQAPEEIVSIITQHITNTI